MIEWSKLSLGIVENVDLSRGAPLLRGGAIKWSNTCKPYAPPPPPLFRGVVVVEQAQCSWKNHRGAANISTALRSIAENSYNPLRNRTVRISNQMVAAIGRSGGARPGAGRKPGSGVVRATARMAVDMAHKLGLHPLEVLLTQMKYFHEQSLVLGAELQGLIEAGATDPKTPAKIASKLNQMIRFFEMARVRAVDAAPYCHARLAAVALEEDNTDPAEAAASFEVFATGLNELSNRIVRAEMRAEQAAYSPMLKSVGAR